MDTDMTKLILELIIVLVTFWAGFAGGTFYTKKKYNINKQKNSSINIGSNNSIKQENRNNGENK